MMSYSRVVTFGRIGVATGVAFALASIDWTDSGAERRPATATQQTSQQTSLRAPNAAVDTIEGPQVDDSSGRYLAPHRDVPRLVGTDDTHQVAMQAVALLAETPGQDADSALAEAALSHMAPAVREEAVYALGERDSTIAVQTLQQALQDPNPRVREAACQALASMGGDEAILALSSALGSEDASLRVNAMDALAEIGGPAAHQHLQRMLADEDNVVREAAGEWLAELAAEGAAQNY